MHCPVCGNELLPAVCPTGGLMDRCPLGHGAWLGQDTLDGITGPRAPAGPDRGGAAPGAEGQQGRRRREPPGPYVEFYDFG